MLKTPQQLFKERQEKEEISKVMSLLGKRSGKNMTPEQRSERARNAVRARWSKTQE